MIDVCLLGSGGMLPLPDRWLSSLLVRHDGRMTLIDCGEGTQIALRTLGWGLRAIDAILISHYHADHVSGLVGILLTLANAERNEPVTIYGPPGLRLVVDGQRVIAPNLPFELRCRELAPGERFSLGGLGARCAAGRHGLPVLAYRLDLSRRPRFDPARAEALGVPLPLWKRLQAGEAVRVGERAVAPEEVLGPPRRGLAVAYVTDTRPTAALRELARGVDLLVCEAMFADPVEATRARETGHMTFAEAAALGREAGARALWLTHFSPSVESPLAYRSVAEAVFPGAVVGVDGLTTTLSFADE